MYFVVNFTKENTLAVVPQSWCNSFGKCRWPKGYSMGQISKLAKEKKEPNKGWDTHPIKVLFKSMCYTRAREACMKAEDTSDLGTESESHLGRGKRAKKRKAIISDSEESNTDNGNDSINSKKDNQSTVSYNGKNKKPKRDIIPPAPIFKPNKSMATKILAERENDDDSDILSNAQQMSDVESTKSSIGQETTEHDCLINQPISPNEMLTSQSKQLSSTTLSTDSSFFQRIRLENSAASSSNGHSAMTVHEWQDRESIYGRNQSEPLRKDLGKNIQNQPISPTEMLTSQSKQLSSTTSSMGSSYFQRLRLENSAASSSNVHSTMTVHERQDRESIYGRNQSQPLRKDLENNQKEQRSAFQSSKSIYHSKSLNNLGTKFPRQVSNTTIPELLGEIPDKRFKSTVISMLVDLSENVKVLTQLMNESILSGGKMAQDFSGLPNFPLESISDLKEFDEMLLEKDTRDKAINKLASWGAKKVKDSTRGIMRRLLSHELSLNCNWTGAHDKFEFQNLKLNVVIIDAVRLSTGLKVVKELDIQNVIKMWFKHAKDRQGGRLRRSLKANSDAIGDEEMEQSE